MPPLQPYRQRGRDYGGRVRQKCCLQDKRRQGQIAQDPKRLRLRLSGSDWQAEDRTSAGANTVPNSSPTHSADAKDGGSDVGLLRPRAIAQHGRGDAAEAIALVATQYRKNDLYRYDRS